MRRIIFVILVFLCNEVSSQITPEIYSWKQNLNGITGYNGIPADVQQVFFSANYVYVKCTGIPSYTIGPWNMNPNVPTNQNWTFKIARHPVIDSTPTAIGNGQTGVLINGVVIFNSGDAMSYNNQNIWHRVAQYFESVSFDTSGGHPAPGGVYHYHINMKKLYTPNSNQHSPVIGYLFDGNPLYGPYAYSNPNGTGGIRRMISGYVKRNITTRTTLPDGTVLPQNQWGPAVNSQYPLGCFMEDYEVTSSGADLDMFNGRYCVTPEYPGGVYAYFITVDSLENPVYPYLAGSKYRGELVAGNTPPGGHVVISEPVTQYIPTSVSNSSNTSVAYNLYQNYPNPFNPETSIKLDINKTQDVCLKIYDAEGKLVEVLLNDRLIPGSYVVKFNGSNKASGVYYYSMISGNGRITKRMLLIK